MEQVDALVSVAKSKPAKDLMKCAEKNCDKYIVILEKEKETIEQMKKLKDSLSNPKDTEGLISKSLTLTKLTKELAKLNTDKDSLMCAFTKCGKEYADLYVFRNKQVEKVLDKQEKLLEKIVKRQQKRLKEKEKAGQ